MDIGFGANNDPSPAWLVDENVRKGIVAMLEIDRCDEEDERLSAELRMIGRRLESEWSALQRALMLTQGELPAYPPRPIP